MRNIIRRLYFIICLSFYFLNSPAQLIQAATAPGISRSDLTPDLQHLCKDFMSWYTYTYQNIRLAKNFIAIDVNSNQTDKLNFLKTIVSGNVIPIRIPTEDEQLKPTYKLFKVTKLGTDIQNTIIEEATTAIELLNMERKQMPNYHFSDLHGKEYDNSNTKGKIVLLKCWFIHCVACVKEFTELNSFVDKNRSRNDILFISLASDSKADLEKFLASKPFHYAVIPGQSDFMTNQLKVNAYPLHLLINGNGIIVKATNSFNDILPYAELLCKIKPSTDNTKSPVIAPPPPPSPVRIKQ
jgi:thiol-disulfide isomerase/thioredoxin